jgi:YVTN family beta-propeller protein
MTMKARARRAAHRGFRLRTLGIALVLVASLSAAATDFNKPTGTQGLFAVDKVGGRVRFFDVTGEQELAVLDVSDGPGSKPHEFVLSRDHKLAYVTNYGTGVYGNNPSPGHTIAIIDVRERRQVGTIDVAPYRAPHGIQIDPKGMLYVACDLDHRILVIDPLKRSIEAAIDTGGTSHWIAMTPDGSKLYASNKDDGPFVTVIDVKGRRVVAKIPMPRMQGIAASPDGKTVLVSEARAPIVHVIATATDTEIDRVTMDTREAGINKIFYSPDGRHVIVTQGATDQFNIFRAADLHAPQIVARSAGTALMGFAFATDGRHVIVGNHGEGTASEIDLENGRVTRTFPAGKGIETLAFY